MTLIQDTSGSLHSGRSGTEASVSAGKKIAGEARDAGVHREGQILLQMGKKNFLLQPRLLSHMPPIASSSIVWAVSEREPTWEAMPSQVAERARRFFNGRSPSVAGSNSAFVMVSAPLLLTRLPL